MLRAVGAGTAGVIGDAFLRALVTELARVFSAELAFVAETLPGEEAHARVVAVSSVWPGALAAGHELRLAGTPWAAADPAGPIACPTGARERFPDDPLMARHGIEGALGLVLLDAAGSRRGHLALLSTSRLDASPDDVTALRVLAARAGAEIERRRRDDAQHETELELAMSRARIVQAADDERRRLGRALHDGAQQRLVVLGQCLDIARAKLAGAPEDALAMLARGREQTSAAADELREFGRGLHPVGLTEQGLRSALASLAAQSPLPLHIDELPDRRLPETLEVTVYYLVSEALANAMKHAAASRLTIRVALRGSELVASVADDGVGGATARHGSGLHGLGARLDALGGTLTVESPAGGGTRLEVGVPMGPWRSAREPVLEFGFEGDGGLGERLVDLVLSGEKTASVALAREWDLEGGPPRIGQCVPIMDAHGRHKADVEVTRVAALPFGLIGEEAIAADAAGASGVEEWRAMQRRLYARCRDEVALLLDEPDWRLTDEEPMVITWFRLAG